MLTLLICKQCKNNCNWNTIREPFPLQYFQFAITKFRIVIANNQYLEFLSCQFVEHLRVRSTNEIQLQHNPACQPAKHPAYLLNHRTPSSVEIRLKHDLRCPHQMPSSIVIGLGARKVVATAMCSINILYIYIYIYTNTNTHTQYIFILSLCSVSTLAALDPNYAT
jgi:hypothetical protein